jgi:capsular polysaccharide biosynthesis protein
VELRAYWAVIWRWKLVALAVAAVAFVASFAIQTREPITYQATVRLALNPRLPMTAGDYSPAQHQYYEYIASEYLNDDIMKVTEGASFKAAVTQRASALLGRPVDGALENEKAHKLMQFTVTADDADAAVALGKAVAEVLTDPQSSFYQLFVTYNPTVTLVDEVRAEAAVPASRVALYMLLRVLLALVAGLGLAFLLEYLDDTVRSAREVESVTGLPVLAEIPATGRRAAAPAAPTVDGRAQTA